MTTKNRMAGIPTALFPASAFFLGTYAKADTAASEASYGRNVLLVTVRMGKVEALKTQDFAAAAVQSMSDAELTAVNYRSRRQDACIWHEPKAGSG